MKLFKKKKQIMIPNTPVSVQVEAEIPRPKSHLETLKDIINNGDFPEALFVKRDLDYSNAYTSDSVRLVYREDEDLTTLVNCHGKVRIATYRLVSVEEFERKVTKSNETTSNSTSPLP